MTPLIPPSPILSVRDLHVSFGSVDAVRGLSFDIEAGETLALVGESGSGKSATALSILRLIEREGGRIAGGQIRLGGDSPVDVTTLPPAALRRLRGDRIAMVFQEPMTSLNPVMTVGAQLAEVLTLHRSLRGGLARDAARAALDRVAVPEPVRRLDQYPHELSGGLRQRVMIAMALICEPDVLIADEPTTALDVTTQAEILSLIAGLQRDLGMAVLFITHDLGIVSQIADRVVVMKDGRKVEEGHADVIFAAPQDAYTGDLIAATPRLGAGSPDPLAPAAPVLKLSDLSVRYGGGGLFGGAGTTAVDRVSLEVMRGETLGLVGESGCGKSSIARAVMRLIDVAAGRIALLGTEIQDLPRTGLKPHRAKMQMVFQDPYASLNPRLPVRDLVTEPAYLHGMTRTRDRKELARDLLERVGLPGDAADHYPHQFSGGQRQRICIARALSVRPQLIVADEAVSALDVSTARRVTDLMAQIQVEEGVSFLFISHDIALVERVSHRVAVMHDGKIVETGPTQRVLHDPQHAYTRRLLSSVPRISHLPRGKLRAASMPGTAAPLTLAVS